MNSVRRRGLPVLIGFALTAGLVAVASPARADGEPTAAYALDSTSIWTGQQIKLSESDGPASATRTIDWGDGTQTQATESATWSHNYASTGSFAVKVTLNDGTSDGAGTFAGGSTVAVRAVPGSYGWQQPTIYTYPGYQESATFQASGVPTNATRVWNDWTDGETSLMAAKGTATGSHYFGEGTWTPRITLQNAQGKATAKAANPLRVLLDQTAPTVSLTVPAKPNKASSWSKITGRLTDSQSGPDVAGIQLWKFNATTDYYFDFVSRKWVKWNGKRPPASAQALRPVDAKGNWYVYSSGLTKGWSLEVDYYGWDQVGNDTDTMWRTFKLTS